MLISAVIPMMALYQLPHGQYGYRGHIINLLQDIDSFARVLPRYPKDLDVIIIRKEGITAGSHKDFRVRRSKVLHALQWLIANNIYYRCIQLDQDALSVLPEDGDISNLVSVTVQPPPDISNEQPVEPEDPYSAILSQTFVPMNYQRATEQEVIRQSVEQYQSHQPTQSSPVLMWPQSADTPINEFHTEGYITCAFPTLFPTGKADFTAPRERQVTIGNYFKHLMLYKDERFAKHPRFRYFALNTEMRWCALQTGRIYVQQHPHDAHLSVAELQDMIAQRSEAFSSRVQHFACSLRGTRSYWYRQRSRLISMVDTLGLPTIFFTHSAADLQWPNLAHLMSPSDPDSSASRRQALAENPAIADWFFHERIRYFIEEFYVGILGATDYWLRFEWQHRGSPHVHGLAWLPNAPDIQHTLESLDYNTTALEGVVSHIDGLVTTMNPAILNDGSNESQAPPPQTNPHICNKPYVEVQDYHQDYVDLIATCQRHTRCSPAYCLRSSGGRQKCRFGYPKPLHAMTTLTLQDGEPELTTARNDGLINSHNPIQLSGWRANVDMQYCVSRR